MKRYLCLALAVLLLVGCEEKPSGWPADTWTCEVRVRGDEPGKGLVPVPDFSVEVRSASGKTLMQETTDSHGIMRLRVGCDTRLVWNLPYRLDDCSTDNRTLLVIILRPEDVDAYTKPGLWWKPGYEGVLKKASTPLEDLQAKVYRLERALKRRRCSVWQRALNGEVEP